jgi:tetratricopeptide (TPR) repeat protein
VGKEEEAGAVNRAAAVLLLLQACAAPDPRQADPVYQEALHRLSREDDPAAALPLLDRALRIDPARADILATRALVLSAAGRPDEALADYARILDHRKNAPPGETATFLLSRGILLTRIRRGRDAEADFSEAVRLDPDLVEARLRRARLRRLSGRAGEADEDEAEARRRGAARANDFYNEGVRILKHGARDEAELYFSFAAVLEPGHVRAWVALGRVLVELNRAAEAVRAYDRAVEIEPGRADLYYHRGNARLAAGKPEEAVFDYTTAIDLDPRPASYHAARGAARYYGLRDPGKAREDFDRAIERDPLCRVAWADSGVLFRETGPLDEAERRLRKALEISATPDTMRLLGLVLLDKGNWTLAQDIFQKALAICRDETLRKAIEEDLERAKKGPP